MYEENQDISFTKKDQFYSELLFRSRLINDLGLDIFTKNLNKELTEQYIKFLEGARETIQSFLTQMTIKEKTFLTHDITMNQLLEIKHLLTKSQYNLVKNNKTIKSLQDIYNEIDEEQHFYYEIWDDIYNYLIDSEEAFTKWSKIQYCSKDKINKQSYIADLNEIILDIYDSVEKVIEYLRLSNKLNKYKNRLVQYFMDSNPEPVIYNQKLRFAVSRFVYPNKIINFQIDLNDSLKDQKENLEQLYKEYHNKSIKDFKFIDNDNIQRTNHTSNMSRRNIYDMFFAFDAFLYGASINDITTLLYENNDNTEKIISEKTVEKYIENIKNLLFKQAFKELAAGRPVIFTEYSKPSFKKCEKAQTIPRI
ncbi:MAG: hypothetical protein DRG78_11305 [Epsilonproteobacteria bacterium]|nr:MAG: hypothetical protein DRG78_11305 [Campylobacterota bacterium]